VRYNDVACALLRAEPALASWCKLQPASARLQ
jgi:hypothetical protein